MLTVICPGSFDPVTEGHLDIIRRSCNMFDYVIVAVMSNFSKTPAFSKEERIDFLKRATSDLKNLEILTFDGMLVDLAKARNACAIIKGLRAVSDFEYEFQMALTNKKLYKDIETIFLTTNSKYMYLSSSIVKQVASLGGDISEFVPKAIINDIKSRFYIGGIKNDC